jgi:hypothetical protein
MQPPREVPVAAAVMKEIPAVKMQDPVVAALERLGEHGVAVLVDDAGRPRDILTSCDLDHVRERANLLRVDSPAAKLFEQEGRDVYRVRRDDDLRAVAQEIARRRLATGIVVVDDAGRYAGYLFNDDLRASADAFVREAKQRAESVQASYPEAWSALGGRLPSSAR